MRYCKLELSSSSGGPVIGTFNGAPKSQSSEFCSSCLAEAAVLGLELSLVRMDFDELLRRLDAQLTIESISDHSMYRRTLYAALVEHGWNKAEYLEALSVRIGELEALKEAAL